MKLYRINWQNKIYIGELSDDSRKSLQYHVAPALRWLKNEPSGWEIDLQKQGDKLGWNVALKQIKNNGEVSFENAQQTISRFLDKLAITAPYSPYYQQTNYQEGSLLHDFALILKPVIHSSQTSIDLLFIEALLIGANGAQHNSLNQHINTGTYAKKVDKDFLQRLFTPSKLKDFQQSLNQWMPKLYLTFDLSQLPKSIVGLLKLHYRRGIDIVHEDKFINQVGSNRVIKESTIKSITTQLNNHRKLIDRRPGSEARIALIDDFIKNEIPKFTTGKSTYIDLANALRKSFGANGSTANFTVFDDKLNEAYSKLFMQFFTTFPIDQLFKQVPNFHEQIDKYVRNSFKDYIQKNIFANFNEEEFAKWQHQKAENEKQIDHGGQNYQWFYFKYASLELNQTVDSLYAQTKAQIETLKIPFITNNWHQIYREQVSLWLKDKDDIGRYANYHRFLHLSNVNEITCY